MKRVMLFAAAAALIAMGPPSLLAQSQQSPPARSGRPLDTGVTSTIASDSLIGAKVKDTQGNEIGEVKTLLIDPRDGRVVSLMISRGGLLGTFGIGGKQEAVSWDAVEVQRDDQQKIVVTMRQSTLERAPRSDRSQPPQQPSASPPTGSTQPSNSTPPAGSTQPSDSTPSTGSTPSSGSTSNPSSTPYPGSTPRQ